MHMHACTHAHTHAYEKNCLMRSRQAQKFKQRFLQKKILGNFYVVVVVPILWDLLAAGNDGLEYRLP